MPKKSVLTLGKFQSLFAGSGEKILASVLLKNGIIPVAFILMSGIIISGLVVFRFLFMAPDDFIPNIPARTVSLDTVKIAEVKAWIDDRRFQHNRSLRIPDAMFSVFEE